MILERGMDFRKPEYRREVFLRQYEFSLRYRSFPGGVHYLLPWLRAQYEWTTEEALWFAFLNGNTQHPVTSLILWERCRDPHDSAAVERMIRFFRRHYAELAFDTDRRHWKKSFPQAVESYRAAVGPSQETFWYRAAEQGFSGVWKAATSLYGFGRLSSFSYAEYLWILGVPFDCDRLFLEDREGSRSHRNGLCIVGGWDEMDWHASNPSFDGRYSPAWIDRLGVLGQELLGEARGRTAGTPWAGLVSYFTLESALCTYKSWHRPNRRYPNVYNDLMYDRLIKYRRTPFEEATAPFWGARLDCLPAWLMLEFNPTDPGCVPVKQNWYRETGEVPMLGHEDPVFWSGFDEAVQTGDFGLRRDIRGEARVLR